MSDEPDERPRFEPKEHERKLPHLTKDDLDCVIDEFGREHFFMKDGRAVCGRLKKKHNRKIPDEACLGIPMSSGPCRIHGGKAGRPIEHGRYSRVLDKWKKDFVRAQKDKQLLDAKQDLALMDVALEKLLMRAEEGDCPSWRQLMGETFVALQMAIRGKRQAQVSAMMKELATLIETGATEDQIAADLVLNVERRANRACRIGDLELKKEDKVTPTELAAVFRSWLVVLEKALEPRVYARVLPELRRATVGQQIEAT
ncbi:MAG: hypothetical protein GY733_22425 [bacterium]|nr:hypothetical protein [bacterium]